MAEKIRWQLSLSDRRHHVNDVYFENNALRDLKLYLNNPSQERGLYITPEVQLGPNLHRPCIDRPCLMQGQ